ncbi:hypothetical protein LA76x_4966 [Lysobacter antibioticus]|uniref:Uncharacterized protein n=1 Tax=Lysobacter antibioticus TaxID=84531 RepID=A0A0S2FHN8_LYSAN|nr:hypothetical protein LA76x_4966 [Lysobacter antibioticus]
MQDIGVYLGAGFGIGALAHGDTNLSLALGDAFTGVSVRTLRAFPTSPAEGSQHGGKCGQ